MDMIGPVSKDRILGQFFRLIITMTLGCSILLAVLLPRERIYRYCPDGYYDNVNSLISLGLINIDTTAANSPPDQLCLTIDTLELTDQQRHFLYSSYLRDDLRLHNLACSLGERSRFFRTEVSNRDTTIKLLRSSRMRITPLMRSKHWAGDVLYRGASQVRVLWHRKHPIYIPDRPYNEGPSARPDAASYVSIDLRDVRGVRSPAIDFIWNRFENHVASVIALGDNVVLSRRASSDIIVRLNGYEVEERRELRLDNGDILTFVEANGDEFPVAVYQYFDEEARVSGRFASRSLIRNGVLGRSHSNSLTWLPQLTTAVELLFNGGLLKLDDGLTVHLTIDHDLQNETDQILQRYVNSRSDLESRPRRAAINLIDARTGDVLALASYRDAGVLTSTLKKDPNFTRFAVGSAVKPLWVAAALTVNPALGNLKVEGHDDIAALLGYSFDTLSDAAHWSNVDGVSEFIERSCNVYAVALGMCALASDPAAGTPEQNRLSGVLLNASNRVLAGPKCWIDNQRIKRSLDLRHYVRVFQQGNPNSATGSCLTVANMTESQLYRAFTRLFDVSRGAASGQKGLYRFQLWEYIANQFGFSTDDRLFVAGFAEISPEATDLRWDLAHSLRNDIMSDWLGDGDCRFAPLLFTANYAQLILNRRISLRCAGPPLGLDQARDFPSLGLADSTVNVIRQGCRDVIMGEGGSARDILRSHITELANRVSTRRKGDQLLVYAKTGTPFAPGASSRTPSSRRYGSVFLFVCHYC